MDTPTILLAKRLMAIPSITPDDKGCQILIGERLEQIGFELHHLPFNQTSNLWAVHGKDEGPLLVLLGHTDVVPVGNVAEWKYPPFQPTIDNGFLYGRGSADMKGGLSALIVAAEKFIKKNKNHKGKIAFLITSDEEGTGVDGTPKVLDYLNQNNIKIDYCLVGEPSSEEGLGDVIKNGHRGSLNGYLKIKGMQGHIAYPYRFDNPIHKALPALEELINTQWDLGNQSFQPTSFQISNINAGLGATNVIPAELNLRFNFRFSTEVNFEILEDKVSSILNKYKLIYELRWERSGIAFITPSGKLLDCTKKAIKNILNKDALLSTEGGTSDGRFIAPLNVEVIELGPNNSTIHAVNEKVSVEELEQLTLIYENIFENILL
ncbi:MAG: succinyl-diaminopimelate desuccinylase [Francisellaceae bacterium]|nr:succinyl-diaminopimelate desuccinylase [Francisellaceae bacterium]